MSRCSRTAISRSHPIRRHHGPGRGARATIPTRRRVLHWEDYRRSRASSIRSCSSGGQPVRDWLADPSNRRDLVLRYQISRQARLWRRTDCNREYLLGEAGYAAARRFADAYGEELEPLELEFLEQSHQHLVLQRRRNRWARLLGLTLAALLVFATGAAFWAWDASREATLNLQRSLLKAADLAVRQGNTPEAVRLALNAGPYLPEAATDTLSRAFTTNRMIAMVQSEVDGGRPAAASGVPRRRRAFGDSITGEGAQLWALRGQSFQPEARLSGPETRSIRYASSAAASRRPSSASARPVSGGSRPSRSASRLELRCAPGQSDRAGSETAAFSPSPTVRRRTAMPSASWI
jgi:hypothetical protein